MKLIILIALLLPFQLKAQSLAVENNFVITACRAGNIHLGMMYFKLDSLYTISIYEPTEDELEEAQYNDRYVEPPYSISEYNISFDVDDESNMDSATVWNIAIYDRSFKTVDGLGVGSTINDLLKFYPDAVPHHNQVSQRAWLELGNCDFDFDINDYDRQFIDFDVYSDSNDVVDVKGFKADAKIRVIRIN